MTAGVADIVGNPKTYKFVEPDAAQLPRSLPDLDAVAVNNNYALQAGLDPQKDSIVKETSDGRWVNIIAVRDEDKDKPWVAAFVQAYHSDAVKQFIAENSKALTLRRGECDTKGIRKRPAEKGLVAGNPRSYILPLSSTSDREMSAAFGSRSAVTSTIAPLQRMGVRANRGYNGRGPRATAWRPRMRRDRGRGAARSCAMPSPYKR